MVAYRRSRDGGTIHEVPGCRFSARGVAWSWADDKSIQEIILGVVQDGGVGLLRQLRFCYFCFGRTPDVDRILGVDMMLSTLDRLTSLEGADDE